MHHCYQLYNFLQVNHFALCLFSEETVTKEKLWSLVSQNEPSLVPTAMVMSTVIDAKGCVQLNFLFLSFYISWFQISKLSVDDCMACIELLVVLLVEHSHRYIHFLSIITP